MKTKSQLKAKLIMIKSALFSFTKKQKIADAQAIEKVMFISACEDVIYIDLKSKWIENGWLTIVIVAIFEVINLIKNIFS